MKNIIIKQLLCIALLSGHRLFGADVSRPGAADHADAVIEEPAIDWLDAVRARNINAARQHIAAGTDVNTPSDATGNTALIILASTPVRLFSPEHITLLRLLLNTPGIDIKARGEWGLTALQNAAARQNAQAVSALLRAGARAFEPEEVLFVPTEEIAELLDLARRAQNTENPGDAAQARQELVDRDIERYGGDDTWEEEGHLKPA